MPEMSAHRRGQGSGRGWFKPYPHDYGPHQDDGPTLVTVWRTKRAKDGTADVPVHPAIIEQRRRLNAIAHDQARARREDQEGSTDRDAD